MGVRQLVKMHIPGPPTPLHQHPEEGTWHELVSATSPGDSEVVLFRPPSKNQGICLENLLSPLNLSFVAVSRWGCRRAGF